MALPRRMGGGLLRTKPPIPSARNPSVAVRPITSVTMVSSSLTICDPLCTPARHFLPDGYVRSSPIKRLGKGRNVRPRKKIHRPCPVGIREPASYGHNASWLLPLRRRSVHKCRGRPLADTAPAKKFFCAITVKKICGLCGRGKIRRRRPVLFGVEREQSL
jgi:hypothetical protein